MRKLAIVVLVAILSSHIAIPKSWNAKVSSYSFQAVSLFLSLITKLHCKDYGNYGGLLQDSMTGFSDSGKISTHAQDNVVLRRDCHQRLCPIEQWSRYMRIYSVTGLHWWTFGHTRSFLRFGSFRSIIELLHFCFWVSCFSTTLWWLGWPDLTSLTFASSLKLTNFSSKDQACISAHHRKLTVFLAWCSSCQRCVPLLSLCLLCLAGTPMPFAYIVHLRWE